ncbi:MAG TPA: FAD-dependent monooxygenase, partial [Gemmatimonadaceae bacterium]|nr:FAD-dependent monooxygenase [Gemmatimonadaceae bacterium]
GPTGLVLALWLTRLGVKVRIIDKASEPGTTSRALAVQARTLELYHQVGLDDAVIAGGVKIQNINLWVKGRPKATVQLTGAGENLTPYSFALAFPQDDHERLLVERLGALGVRVERSTELLRFTQHDRGVTATLRRPDGSEETCDAEYLAGCDGASSAVRAQLGVGFPGGTYSGLFYVADVVGTGAPRNKDLHADIEDADFILLFPLEGDHHWRLVGTVHDLPAGEHGALTFDDVKGKAMEHLRLNVEAVNWFSTYRVHHRVALRFRDRRAFLLGDAAHIHSPVGGQGMNTGIGDAVNLAWKLALALKGGSSEQILDTYEPERIAFARRLVATTDRGFVIVTSRGALARLIRTRIVPLVLPLLFRLRAFRELLFRTVSQTQVNYRNSALSEGAAGKVRGGDRLPWVRLDSGQDNFEALTTLEWQVHVYGEARRNLKDACAELDVALLVFPWKTEMRRAGLQKDALYLVRPDGYVGLADAAADAEGLRRYCASWVPRLSASRR